MNEAVRSAERFYRLQPMDELRCVPSFKAAAGLPHSKSANKEMVR